MRENMSACSIDDFYCRDISNVRWLTEFEGVFDDEPAHLAFVTPKAFVHTDSLCRCVRSYRSIHRGSLTHAAAPMLPGLVRQFAAFHAAAGTPEGKSMRHGYRGLDELREFRELERAFSEAKWKPRFAETDGFVKRCAQ